MKLRACVTAACAILAAIAAGPSFGAPASAALTSFGSMLSASDLAALAIHAPGASQDARLLQPSSFATSQALTPTFALDGSYRVDTARRFTSFEAAPDPLRDSNSFLALADGGHYAGFTYVPTSLNLDMRFGVSNWTGRFDDVSMDGAAFGLPAFYDASHVNSVLAGVTWNVNEWVGLGFNTVASFSNGMPLAYTALAPMAQSAATQALQVSARFNLGNNWSSTAEFGEGVTQVRQRDGVATSLDAQTFAITVAKRGVFGDDAVGFSLSRPALGSIGGFNSLVNSTGDLPPVVAAAAGLVPETDFQVGYVTSFLGGKLALQTNAAYQINPQGQTGASAVSVVQRAKIKF
jgi:hypothetical protein